VPIGAAAIQEHLKEDSQFVGSAMQTGCRDKGAAYGTQIKEGSGGAHIL